MAESGGEKERGDELGTLIAERRPRKKRQRVIR